MKVSADREAAASEQIQEDIIQENHQTVTDAICAADFCVQTAAANAAAVI